MVVLRLVAAGLFLGAGVAASTLRTAPSTSTSKFFHQFFSLSLPPPALTTTSTHVVHERPVSISGCQQMVPCAASTCR